jgi:hypothetical protein
MPRLVPASVLMMALALATVGVAQAGYDGASGGAAVPSVVAVNGGTDYSVSIAGRPATTDLVLVLDNSGSMSNTLGGGGTRWNALSTAAGSFLEGLQASGFFARGGKVGLVFFGNSPPTVAAPTTDVATLKSAIASNSPSGESCITCGLQRATEMLAGIPGSHRRIAYIVADGPTTTPPTVAEAVATAQAAGIERRVIGIGPEAGTANLGAFAGNGTAPVAQSVPELATAFAAQPTRLPGATAVSWSFHLAPGFTASAASASIGTAVAAGGEVTWTIPSLEEGATLTFHATHDPAAGCAATSLLSGTSFSDAEGDAAPAVGLGPLTLTGCAPPPAPVVVTKAPPSKAPPAKLKPAAIIRVPASTKSCTNRTTLRIGLQPPRGTKVTKATVKVGDDKATTYRGGGLKSPLKVTDLPDGRYKVVVTLKLSDGRTVTLSRSYVGCQ